MTTTKQRRYSIAQACEDVAEGLRAGSDHSETTIRCAINDALDAASKDGYRINDGYNQERSVARVKRLLAKEVA